MVIRRLSGSESKVYEVYIDCKSLLTSSCKRAATRDFVFNYMRMKYVSGSKL